MKRIINGIKYDTNTANVVGYGNNGRDSNDCWRENEELYVTNNGNYFICNFLQKIILVNKNGQIQNENVWGEGCDTIKEWLKVWNVRDINKKEMEVFDITNA